MTIQAPATFTETQDEILQAVSSLHFEDSLLYLNHVLGVSRGMPGGKILRSLIRLSVSPRMAHIAHSVARYLIVSSVDTGGKSMGWYDYQRISRLITSLDDAITHDKEWCRKNPTGFLERLMSLQLDPQLRHGSLVQRVGLALGLFRDVGMTEGNTPYDLQAEIENILGVSVVDFISMGLVVFNTQAANYLGSGCSGTIAFQPQVGDSHREHSISTRDKWVPFLSRVSAQRDTLRRLTSQPEYDVCHPDTLKSLNIDQSPLLYLPYSFNPLWRKPIVDLGEGRYIAPDPELIVERVTFGLFYDGFEQHRTMFATRFGTAFEKFVGQLLSCLEQNYKVQSTGKWLLASGTAGGANKKLADWLVQGTEQTVILETKSIRASLHLKTYGAEASVEHLNRRLADAVEQIIISRNRIQAGEWVNEGIRQQDCLGVIVSYGKIHTANSLSVRKRVNGKIIERGFIPIPYVVLSIEELDTVIHLVEIGMPFDSLIGELASIDGSVDPLRHYFKVNPYLELGSCSFIRDKANAFLDAFNHQKPNGSCPAS